MLSILSGKGEDIYVGYRYYEKAGIPVLYPFGYGLSYTEFKYSDLKITEKGISCTISNCGEADGAEVVQMYVGLPNAEVFRPGKELKGFKKIFLKKGESKKVEIPFDDKTFRYFNVRTNKWEVEEGDYEIKIGGSSADIRLIATCHRQGTTPLLAYSKEKMESYYTGEITNVSDSEFKELLGNEIPDGKWSGELSVNDAFCQMYYAKSGLARFVYKRLTAMKKKADESGKPDLNTLFIYNMPFRAMAKMTGGAVDMEMVRGIVKIVNGHFFSGICGVIGGYFRNRSQNKKYEKKLRA